MSVSYADMNGWKKQIYRQCSLTRVLLVSWLAIILWSEYLAFVLVSWKWSTFPALLRSQPAPARVLFVADPQLIGLNDEPPFVGFISRWDSDRYIKKTFQRAYAHVSPDIVIFLGDLLDEGSNANPEEYDSYVQRFRKVFIIPSNVKIIYLPGDNDVGGEGFDLKDEHKMNKFNMHFIPDQKPPENVINYQHLDFFRIDVGPYEMVAAKLERQFTAMRQKSHAPFRIICSHVDILYPRNQIISLLDADLIFSAHSHTSTIHSCTSCRGAGLADRAAYQGKTMKVYDHRIYHMELHDKQQMHEIGVPTCSYRMGVPHMGYSAATMDEKGHVRYTVLWSPGRYPQLYFYIYSLIVTAIVLIIRIFVRLGASCRNTPSYKAL